MKQVLGAINRQAEVNYAQVLNRTLLNKNSPAPPYFPFSLLLLYISNHSNWRCAEKISKY